MSYSMVHKLRNDPAAGCTAQRQKQFTPKKMVPLLWLRTYTYATIIVYTNMCIVYTNLCI